MYKKDYKIIKNIFLFKRMVSCVMCWSDNKM